MAIEQVHYKMRIPVDLRDRLKIQADKEGRSVANLIRWALTLYVEDQETRGE